MKWQQKQHSDTEYLAFVHAYIDALFQQVCSRQDYSTNKTTGSTTVAMTYGELLFSGFEQLQQAVQMSADDVFVDCGSGFGKLCLQALLTTPCHRAIGIELDSELFAVAKKMAAQFEIDCQSILSGRVLNMQHASFFDCLHEEATVMYCGATCFDDEMMWQIGQWMAQHPSLRAVVTLKPLPEFTALPFKNTLRVPCTWDIAQALVYGY